MYLPIRDCYQTLGLPVGASLSEVSARHRQLALELHPDRNQHCPVEVRQAKAQQLSRINHAFDELVKHGGGDDFVMWGPRPPKGKPERVRVPGQGADIRQTVDLRFNQWCEGLDYRVPTGAVLRIPRGAPPMTYRVTGAGEPGRDGAPPGDCLVQVRHLGLHGQVIPAGHEGFRRAGELFNLFLVGLSGLGLVGLVALLVWTLIAG